MKHVAGRFDDWHNGPLCHVVVTPKYGGVGIAIVCLHCHVWADLEGANIPITIEESRKPREEP